MSAQQLAEDLAGRFGLRRRPRSWGGDCPACGYSSAFYVKASPNYARPMLRCTNGCTGEQLAAVAEQALGAEWKPAPPPDEADEAAAREKKRLVAERLWSGSVRVEASEPAGVYLRRRRLRHLIGSSVLRYRADCSHPEGGRLRALVALVQDVAGKTLAAHRTFVGADGRKAAADPPKASLGPIWGGAIRLQPVAAELLVGEGLETSASAGLLLNLPAWAAISAGNLAAGLVLPVELRTITIAADHDGPGQRAARDAAARWRLEGRTVRIATPDRPGADFNDVLMERACG